MKVNTNIPLNGNTGIENSKAVDKKPASENAPSRSIVTTRTSPGNSDVQISEQARLMQKATDIVHATPSVAAERIAQLKKSIQEGSYNPDNAAIADRLVDEHLLNDFGKNNL